MTHVPHPSPPPPPSPTSTLYSRFRWLHGHVNHLTIALGRQSTGNLKVPPLLLQLLPVLHVLGRLLPHLHLQCLLGLSLLLLHTQSLHLIGLATSLNLRFPVERNHNLISSPTNSPLHFLLTIAYSPPPPADDAPPPPWPSSQPPVAPESAAVAPAPRHSSAPAASPSARPTGDSPPPGHSRTARPPPSPASAGPP